jgi:hypothetical protein
MMPLRSRPPSDALTDALAAEARLLDELLGLGRRQRAAVEADDLQAIEDSVYATHRVLRTLAEARRRRDSLIDLLGYPSIAGILRGEASHVPATLRDGCDALRRAAQQLSAEVAVSRRQLREVLSASDPCPLAALGAAAPASA